MPNENKTTVGAGICPECGRDRAAREPHKPGCSYQRGRTVQQLAQEIAGRLRKDFGHDMRHDAGIRWLTRIVTEIKQETLQYDD